MSNTRTTVSGWIAAVAVTLLLAAAPASAQTTGYTYSESGQEQGQRQTQDPQEEPGPWSVSAGLGFTLDPGTFLMTFGAEYAPDGVHGFSAGPLLQIGISDNNTIVAPTVNGRYSFDLSDQSDNVLARIRPFVQGGLGFAYIDKDRNGPKKDKDDVGFLMNMGFGAEYPINDSVTIGNSLLFNVLPDRTARQNFFFSWQFATLRFHF